ncbi:MAG TPA: chitobiase/beta-hexosaminidase C-terminal domain-containing protein [Pseudomonadales bacterium]|nr:chitobiase/beta-hexosaminidase C-terminal domain-containing protein [Pseudomonadales bacterium]
MEKIRTGILPLFTKSLFVWLGLFFIWSYTMAWGQAVDWPTLGFTQVVTTTFGHPTGIAHAGDGSGRLFIVQQPGVVSIVQGGNVLAQPFLNILNRVSTGGAEQGLLGLAFPPGFSTKSHFYVDYTRVSDGAIIISRLSVTSTNANVADLNSEQIILVIPKPKPPATYNNHNAGQLAFGPDGYLYIGVGDGGSEGDPLNYGQATTNMFGKILRIDVENGVSPYAVPPSNPFVSSNNFVHETWAYGLRNPWRFSFDDLTGDLYIGDVGQNMYEEVDFQPAGSPGGQNYGWRIMEGDTNYIVPSGFTNFSALTLPVAVYSHSSLPTDLSGAIIGGYVYRGPSQPRMNGMYFYGDFEAGWIWGLERSGTNWQNQILVNPLNSYPQTNFMISTFGEDDQGNLYLADYYRGIIYQIHDTQQTWTPAFSPAGGTINSNTVIITCLTTNAEIHYTTNGLDPTISDPIIASGGSIVVTAGFTNKAWAFRADLSPSAVARAVYTLQAATPVFSPSSEPITNGTPVSISCVTPGATIYFTTNGTTPTTSSPAYSGPIIMQGNTTLEALAVETGYNNSSIATGSYSLALAATPTFNPPIGPITNGTIISISCSTPQSTIYYTIDGSPPTTNSPVYSGPFPINSGVTVQAFAAANSYGNSSVASATYLLKSVERTVVMTVTAVGGGISLPRAVCLDQAGDLYVANSGNNSVFKILASGQSSLVANISGPSGICMDPTGHLYVASGSQYYGSGANNVWQIQANGSLVQFAGFPGGQNEIGQIKMGMDGNMYAGFFCSVQKITPQGTVSLFGGPGVFGSNTGWGEYVGLGIDLATNVYAATLNNVWEITQGGATSLYAGGNSGYCDGPISSAGFQNLQDATVDSFTNVYVSDGTAVRKISFSGYVSTMAGGGASGFQNGPGSMALFNGAAGLCMDTNGNIYVADSGNNCIREISPDTAGIGIADWWQLKYFGHVGIDPNIDANNNGMTAYQDFWAGLNPTNTASVFKIEKALLTNSGTTISWDSVLGKNYTVQWSSDLVTWNTLGNPVSGNGSLASIIDSTPGRQNHQRFYRVLVNF